MAANTGSDTDGGIDAGINGSNGVAYGMMVEQRTTAIMGLSCINA
jgi:hypothetical protein